MALSEEKKALYRAGLRGVNSDVVKETEKPEFYKVYQDIRKNGVTAAPKELPASSNKTQSSAKQEAKKTAVDKMWDRQSTPRQRTEEDEAASALVKARRNTEQKKKELEDYQNTEYDWTDAAARELYEKGQKQKEAEVSKAQAEQNAAVANFDRAQMNAMSEEDRGLIDEYIRREDTASDPLATGTEEIIEHFVNKNAGIDENRLKQLAETRRRELNAKRMQETQEKAQEEVNDGWMSATWENLKTVPANLISGAMGTMDTIHGLFNQDDRYSGLDPNSMGNQLNVYSGAVRGQTQQNIVGDGSGVVRKGLGALYQGGMSAADTAARMVAGGALGLGAGFGATVAGLNTFSQTMSDASARGATPEQALKLAVTTAGIEAATEKVPLDNLIKVSKGGGAKSLIKNILRQAGMEATEEELSLIGTVLADAAIMQEKSEYNLSVAAYMASGMTEEQAREQANWDLIAEAGETAIVSGIAGSIGVFGAAKTAAYSKEGQLDATPRNGQRQPVADVQGQDAQTDPPTKTAVMEDSIDPKSKLHTGGKVNVEEVAAELAQNAPKPEPEVKTKGQVDADNAAAKVFGVEEAKPQQDSGSTQQADTLETSALDGQTAESDTGMQSAHSGEVKKSKTFTNTGLHSADADIRDGYQQTLDQDPTAGDYQVKHNADTLATAQERTSSPEKCQAEYDYLMSKTDMWSPEDIVTAKLVSKNLMKSGDIDRVSEINIKQAQISSIMGENVQAFSIVGTMKDASDPATAVESATKGFYSMKPEETIYNEKKAGKTFEQWRAENVRNITSIGAEIEKVTDGDDKAMRGIILQLAQHRKTTGFFGLSGNMTHLANKILNKMSFDDLKIIANTQLAVMQDDFRRRTATDIALSTRKLFMLTNLKTFGRNIIGNASTGLMDSVGDSTFGQAADFLLSKITGKRTVGTDITRAKEYASAAAESAQFAALCVELDIPIETTADASFQSAIGNRESGKYIGKTFRANGNIAMRALYAYQKYMSYALEVSDKIFEGGTNAAVAESLARINNSGLTDTDIQELAEYTGNRRTFKDATWKDADGTHGANMSRMTAAGKRLSEKYMGTPGKIVADMLMPYPKVPTNVIQTGIDYTHGVEKGIGEMISILSDVKKHKQISVARQRQAASDFGRGMTGASMLCLLTVAAAKGVIAVHNDKDKNKRALEASEGLSGAQINWSAWQRLMKDEDTTWEKDDVLSSLDAAEPFSILAYMGDELSKDDSFQDVLKAYPGVSIKYTLQALMDSPYMTSISDLWDGVSEAVKAENDDERLGAAAKAASDVAGSFVPQIVRQTAQYNDGYYRDTRGVDSAEYAKNNLLASIPGQSQNLPKKVNGFGQEQERLGWVSTFFDPTNTQKYQKSETSGYLEELSGKTGDTSIYPERQAPMKVKNADGTDVELDGGQREQYQKVYGQYVDGYYSAMIKDSDFNNLPDDLKTAAMNKAKEYAKGHARASVSDFREVKTGSFDEVKSEIIRDVVIESMAKSIGSMEVAWEYGYNTTPRLQQMEEAYDAYDDLSDAQKAEARKDMEGDAARYTEVRENGVSTTDYLKALKAAKNVKGTGTYNEETGENNIRDIDVRGAIAGTGLPDTVVDKLMHAYMPDYDPDAEVKQKTELKYDYTREELGLTPSEYVEAYKVQLDGGKKNKKINTWVDMGFGQKTANLLYRLYAATGRTKIDVEKWWESKQE